MTALGSALRKAGIDTAAAQLYARTVEFIRANPRGNARELRRQLSEEHLIAALEAYVDRTRADMNGEVVGDHIVIDALAHSESVASPPQARPIGHTNLDHHRPPADGVRADFAPTDAQGSVDVRSNCSLGRRDLSSPRHGAQNLIASHIMRSPVSRGPSSADLAASRVVALRCSLFQTYTLFGLPIGDYRLSELRRLLETAPRELRLVRRILR